MNTQLTRSDVRPEIQTLANDFFRHLHASGVRDARKMAIDAAVFSEDRARRVEAMMNDDNTRPEQYATPILSVPSKLRGVSSRQALIEEYQHTGDSTELDLIEDSGKIYAMYRFRILGEIDHKHLAWVRPLLRTGLLDCGVMQVTGGDDGKYYGVNIRLTVDAAVTALLREPEELDW